MTWEATLQIPVIDDDDSLLATMSAIMRTHLLDGEPRPWRHRSAP